MQSIYKYIFSCFIVLLVSSNSKLVGQNYDLYGYFVYTVAKNTEWPPEYTTGDFVIGILGETPAEKSIKQLTLKKSMGDKPMKLMLFKNVSDIVKCNILFLPKERSEEIEHVLKRINNTSIMLITEKEGLAAKGSCVNFITLDEKLAFQINKVALGKQKLKVSSELTKYALAN